MAVVLAIETSQQVGGVALRGDGGTVHLEMLRPQKRHDDDLIPAIDRLFARARLKPADLEVVGVSIGPGGFTGLRIAVSTAKMLAETLGAKVVAAPSALVAAESFNEGGGGGGGPIAVALASKGETFWCARIERDEPGHWRFAHPPGVSSADSIDLDGIMTLLADEHIPQSLRRRCADAGVKVVPPRFEPAACLAVAERMLGRGETVDPVRLSPLYPRPPEAVSLWEKKRSS